MDGRGFLEVVTRKLELKATVFWLVEDTQWRIRSESSQAFLGNSLLPSLCFELHDGLKVLRSYASSEKLEVCRLYSMYMLSSRTPD